ncbi:MAG: DUF4442 domain-containing protein [Bacteroidota bacterium]
MYDKLFTFLNRYFKKATIFKVGFNLSPMYRRSCGKIIFASDDLHVVKIKIPLSYRNKNYVGSIFGGSLFAATDPIYMIQLMQILGKEYVVWDKKTDIRFKRPAYENAFATFEFTSLEIEEIIQKVQAKDEIDYTKMLHITDKNGTIFTELDKTLYISTKTFYKQKRSLKK